MGAWIETSRLMRIVALYLSRTRMGAWIETSSMVSVRIPDPVAPVWVRGLKLDTEEWRNELTVAPVWVRGLKRCKTCRKQSAWCRTRMGAWIETFEERKHMKEDKSHPYGCVD